MRRTTRTTAALATALVVPGLLGACAGTAVPGEPVTGAYLAAGCPAEIRIRTDASPRVEQAALYQLLAEGFEIDVAGRSVSGPMIVDGADTGIRLVIESGDPYGPTGADVLYGDDPPLLAQVDADDALRDLTRTPTVAIFAPLERDPAVVFWDPSYYEVPSIATLGISFADDGQPVLIRGGAHDYALDFLVGSSLIVPEQADRIGDGTLDDFIAADGALAQIGDATIDPYVLEHSEAWDREIEYDLLEEAGYPRYAAMLSAVPADVSRYADCFALLVPALQQATVDFYADPDRTTAAIVQLAQTFGHAEYTLDLAENALRLLRQRGIVGNGGNHWVGDVATGRMQRFIDEATAAFRAANLSVVDGVRTQDLATDAFIDTEIGF